jgi:hypothetical protein
LGHFHRLLHALATTSPRAALRLADAHRHFVQPPGQGGVFPQGVRSPRQHEEHRLKCVFGIFPVAQHSRTDSADERPAALDDHGEGSFIASVGEAPN